MSGLPYGYEGKHTGSPLGLQGGGARNAPIACSDPGRDRPTTVHPQPKKPMIRTLRPALLAAALVFLAAPSAHAQLLDAKVIGLDAARSMMAAAEAEANRNGWPVAIAIVDASGELILFHKLDGTQSASIDIAIGKASTAARLRRPTKALEDAIASGRMALAAVDGILPLEGGVPVIVDGEVIGAVGVSGVTSQQDAQVAEAGIRALGS
jgi:glc operon protein GlcG